MEKLLPLIILLWTHSASAMPISAVDIVTVNGTNWVQVNRFSGLTWNEINVVCPELSGGVCAGVLGGFGVDGWTWASDVEIGDLFKEFGVPVNMPSVDTALEIDSTWAPAFLAVFDPVIDPVLNPDPIVWGLSRTSHPVVESVAFAPQLYDLGVGGEDRAHIGNPDDKSISIARRGAWLYRSAPVPEPATLGLLSLGLLGLAVTRRRQMLITTKSI